jgi:transposase
MLQFKELSDERKAEVKEYIKKNMNESSFDIAKRFNVPVNIVNKMKRKNKGLQPGV